MCDIDVKVKNECIKRIDNHIKELTELKKMLNDGIETNEKVKNIYQYITDIHWKHNDVEQIKGIISMYWDVLKITDN